jgi:hypothetical protein
MVLRANHYDAAFEAYLRFQRWPYVAVNEGRRAQVAEGSLKSLDFIVAAPRWGALLVDVKGRRWPGAGDRRRRWENWVTQDDVESLARWERVFGSGYRGLFVFAYDLPAAPDDGALPRFAFRDRDYAFFGVWAEEYRRAMRSRSPRWETVWLPSRPFRELRFSLVEDGSRTVSTTAP